MRDSVVEPYVEAIFWQELERARVGRDPRRLAELEANVQQCERDLERYRDNPRVARSLTDEQYGRGLAVRSRRLELALLELATTRRGSASR